MKGQALRRPWAGVTIAAAATAIVAGLMAPFRDDVGLLNEGLLFLLITLLAASVWGRTVGILTAVLSNLALNFFFVEPVHTFTAREPKNLVSLFIFLIVSVIGGSLLSAARSAVTQARRQRAETEVALDLSRAMSSQTEPHEALALLCSEVVRVFDAPGAAILTGAPSHWSVLAYAGAETAGRSLQADERAAADRAETEGSIQGFGRTGLHHKRVRIVLPGGRRSALGPERSFALVPLKVGDRFMGILRLDGPIGQTPFREHPGPLLSAVAGEAALTLQRIELANAAARAQALREADEMKSALMASISHDLKTPLAGIKAAISSILDTRISWSADDISAFHKAIDSQTDRLDRVINDILDLTRIESGALLPEPTEIRAADLLETARRLTAYETAGRQVTVDAPSSLTVVTDDSLIVQAVVNLIENAVKYSRPGGAIRLQAVGDEGVVELSVADEGPGIAADDLPYVFERFYRSQEHDKRIQGSGLGLAIVKAFVEICGGRASVESSIAGTRFLIRLPAGEREKARV